MLNTMIRSNSKTFSDLVTSGNTTTNQSNTQNNTNGHLPKSPVKVFQRQQSQVDPDLSPVLQEKQVLHQRLQQQFQSTLRQRLIHQQSLSGVQPEESFYFKSIEDPSDADFYSSQYKVPIIKENEENWVRAKAKGNWKRIKEISKKEEKRPPWQGPSLSTLNKPDKDALLRAKLLDVTRRMRQSRNTVSTQTENLSTKLMKEVCTDVPYDLVNMIDAEVATDEWVTLRHAEGPGIFLFTHSIALMTDRISAEDETTQTPTVKNIAVRIDNKYLKARVRKLDDVISKQDKISKQLDNIREANRILNIPQPSFVYKSEVYLNKFSNDKLPNKQEFLCHKGSNTYSYWGSGYFDYLSGTKIKETYNKNVLIESDEKTSKMLLSPHRKKPILKNRPSIWNEMQQTAIALLIREAGALQRVFEQIAFAMGPGLKYKPIEKKKFDVPEFLSDKLEPVLNSSRKLIEEKKASVKDLETLIQVENC
ncbi:uncharacterized protein LOC129607548 [Condylostylus longicornis]|uniref:uncharacterized protein LOC129607548 n=1 Tax=Condylostylus longicornis TaxID=2530218 RepID=UPI00244E0F8C|nr:uncharacterized protein LOC129607548 [Condylostylus longicornis]